jgi:GT2 family glycosyltransferase
VPSFRRPRDLARCLQALADQVQPPDEVIVVVRAGDQATRDCAAASRLPVTEILVAHSGQVAALNAGLDVVEADVVAVTDDDAAPHCDWLERILGHLADPEVAGVGGRDVVIGSVRPPMDLVGKVRWHGRVVGNHHRGVGLARPVDVLKGTNMAFRTEWLRRFRFEERLRGAGAQVHNDLLVSLRIVAAGGVLIYDPAVLVDHYPAARPQGDHRMDRGFQSVRDATHNETLALLEFLPASRRLPYLAWGALCGTRTSPGLAVAVASVSRRDPVATALAGSIAGRILGVMSWLKNPKRRRRSTDLLH